MSEKPVIKLLLADVDGTLVTKDKILTDRAIAAVHAMHEAGIALALTSGRPPRGMQKLVEPLRLETPVAGFNGGVLVNPDMSVIESRMLSPEAAHTALKTILDKGLDAWLYTPDAWLIRDRDAPHVERESHTVGFEPVIVPEFTEEHLAKLAKIVGVGDDFDLVAEAEAAAQKALGPNASAARSQPYYLDITHPDANKGFVADWLSKRFDIPRENIATIGDMPNDVLMFVKSGFSIAMGNASDQVKAQATAVTDSFADEGFAKAVERFVLRHAPD
jgi:Cof subfamily protein (haloacid dehalogenase superfamily)